MIFKALKLGEHRTNCYIIGSDKDNIAVVDPGYEGEAITQIINENNFKVKQIILTHGHYDHIGQVKYLKELTKAEILIHKNDAQMLVDPYENLSAYICPKTVVQVEADRILEGNETIKLGDLEMKIIHTPGHTHGGICILFNNHLISGDTLFRETVGRTDLPHSNHKDILKSIEKLMEFDNDVKVYPGHGDPSTIGHEKKYNPFVRI